MNIPNVKHYSRKTVEHKEKEHIEKVQKGVYEHGDPDFVDERKNITEKKKSKPQKKKEESFLESLFDIEIEID